jgi:hypothetical protein
MERVLYAYYIEATPVPVMYRFSDFSATREIPVAEISVHYHNINGGADRKGGL